MSDSSFFDPDNDPYRPPDIPTMVVCSQCGKEFDSYLMQWQQVVIQDELVGFWACPTQSCEGSGFGIDIIPLDPEYGKEYLPTVPSESDFQPDNEICDFDLPDAKESMDKLFNPSDDSLLDFDDLENEDEDDCPWSPF